MKKTFLESEFGQYIIKVIIIGLSAITIKLAVDIKNKKVRISWINIILSFIIGVGGAIASGGVIVAYTDKEFHYPLIGLFSILTENIVRFFSERFNVDIFLIAVTENILQGISNFINPKK